MDSVAATWNTCQKLEYHPWYNEIEIQNKMFILSDNCRSCKCNNVNKNIWYVVCQHTSVTRILTYIHTNYKHLLLQIRMSREYAIYYKLNRDFDVKFNKVTSLSTMKQNCQQ